MWKGAPASSLATISTANVIAEVLKNNNINPNVLTVVQGDKDIAEAMASDHRIPLVSFTGSTQVGALIRHRVESRFGRCLLELGGNRAASIDGKGGLVWSFDGNASLSGAGARA